LGSQFPCRHAVYPWLLAIADIIGRIEYLGHAAFNLRRIQTASIAVRPSISASRTERNRSQRHSKCSSISGSPRMTNPLSGSQLPSNASPGRFSRSRMVMRSATHMPVGDHERRAGERRQARTNEPRRLAVHTSGLARASKGSDLVYVTIGQLIVRRCFRAPDTCTGRRSSDRHRRRFRSP